MGPTRSFRWLWLMPGGAQHGQENDLIRLVLICRRIFGSFSNRRAWLSALQPRRDNHLTNFQIPTNHCIPDSPETVTSSRSLTTVRSGAETTADRQGFPLPIEEQSPTE